MASEPRQIKCKACAKLLATVTAYGLAPTTIATTTQDCDACQQFRPLYSAMEAADEEYASFKDRRDTYRPKQDALVKVKQTHMAFNNWLMGVESDSGYRQKKEVDESTKRARSLSLSSEATLQPSTISSREGDKRDAAPERKRFRFADEVEFREDYRPSQHYARSEKTYVRGRYAAPESSHHLDTSGSAKTFLRFTGMKKVGKEWVDVWKDDEDEDGKHIQKRAMKCNNVRSADFEVENGDSSAADATQVDAGPTNGRAQRLARRSGSAREATQQKKDTIARTRSGRTSGLKQISTKEHVLAEPLATTGAATVGFPGTEQYVCDAMGRKERTDIASPITSDVESSSMDQEASLPSMTVSDESRQITGGGGSEVDLAHAERAKIATKEGHHKHESVVQNSTSGDEEEDQQHETLTRGSVEIPYALDKKDRLRARHSNTTNSAEVVAAHQSNLKDGNLGEHNSPASMQNKQIGPDHNRSPGRYHVATASSSQLVHQEPQQASLSFDAHHPSYTGSYAQHAATDPATEIRNAGTGAAGEMLVIASRTSKDQPS